MSDDTIPIEALIASVQEQILNGLHEDFTIDGSIDIEVSVSKATDVDGKVKLFVFQAGVERDKESIAKIKFKIRPKLQSTGMGIELQNPKLRDTKIQRP